MGEPEIEDRMFALASHPRCVAVGEMGLDYCKAWESFEVQRRIFERLCHTAVRLRKTLVLHARDSPIDTLQILRANIPLDWPIHLHGYTGEIGHVEEFLATFPKSCV